MARIVFTIHGINTTGPWQADVQSVLEPHFHCVPLPYTQFRRLGWLKIFIPPLRQRALREVAEQFSAQVLAGEHPHLIAHSFGTRLAVELMKRPLVRFGRVAFTGCPLPARFDWDGELANNPRAFDELTNERGLGDRVIALAGKVGIFLPLLGNAGRVGFQGRPDLIHDTGALRVSCPLCNDLEDAAKARIHNISWKGYTHSAWFVGSGHSANFWLPYFWGFAPEEYSQFIAACLRLVDLEDHEDWLNLEIETEELAARRWSWTRRGRTVVDLREYVGGNLAICLDRRGIRRLSRRKVEAIRELAIGILPGIVKEALAERRKPAERRENIVRRLHPQVAIGAAIKAAVDETAAD